MIRLAEDHFPKCEVTAFGSTLMVAVPSSARRPAARLEFTLTPEQWRFLHKLTSARCEPPLSLAASVERELATHG